MKEEFLKKTLNVLSRTCEKLEEREKYINSLNVFPVPDGDTGTNMLMTLREALDSPNGNVQDDLKNIAESIVLKAHGNSGVIFSSFLKGFLEESLRYNGDEPTILTKAFEKGVEIAYKVVEHPAEGTILTVMRECAKGMKEGNSLTDKITKAYNYGLKALEETKELLPTLKEAGVVDAGGDGFLSFLEALYEVFTGQVLATREKLDSSSFNVSAWRKRPEYKNCVDLVIDKNNVDPDIREELKQLGDSIILIEDEKKVKIHIHTNDVDRVVKCVSKLGTVENINVRNMVQQQLEALLDVETAVVAFTVGEQLSDLFYSLGASVVIDKSEEITYRDLADIINTIPAQNIILLPNDREILSKFIGISKLTTKKADVLETESIPQGIEALLNFNSALTFEENISNIKESIRNIKDGFIDVSKAHTVLNDIELEGGEFFATSKDKVIVKGKDLLAVIFDLLDKFKVNMGSMLLIYGGKVDSTEIDKIKYELSKKYPDLDIETFDGGIEVDKVIYSIKEQD